ncbi:alpha/beta hydrolase [Mangrovibacterium lignilyticum]|uniref:alpha/beta hydrolase n=1 Tax=Mangrovibacterium lignilyticum TaxID=2668052 RepID=UPI0013D6A5B6|nr:alpha/beta hydrolase [Mangrovibacterium lignilyticum]
MSLNFETIDFITADGITCNLKHLIQKGSSPKGPVLLVHGAGVRANIFNAPTQKNIIEVLAEDGYDVWLENWRASIDLKPRPWNLDEAALNDHPAAVRKIVELTGCQEMKAIIHCQGSTSFMISAVLGLVPQVKTIISNAVSLHPVVPNFSVFKLNVILPVVKLITDDLNPAWGLKAIDLKSRLFRLLVRLTHWEKDTFVGKFVSFTYGAGFPALWRLENLDRKTMDWIQYEFASVPTKFFDQIRKCVHRGVLVPADSASGKTYADEEPKTDARFIFFGGEYNLCFKPQSQANSFNYFNQITPGRHKFYLIKGYSHLDIFLGKNAHEDIFPLMLKELNT